MSDIDRMVKAIRKDREERQRQHDELLAELRRSRSGEEPISNSSASRKLAAGYEANARRRKGESDDDAD